MKVPPQAYAKMAYKEATEDMEKENWENLPYILQQFKPGKEHQYPHVGLTWHGRDLKPFQKCPMCSAICIFREAKTDWVARPSLAFGELGRLEKEHKGCCSEPLPFVVSLKQTGLFPHVRNNLSRMIW